MHQKLALDQHHAVNGAGNFLGSLLFRQRTREAGQHDDAIERLHPNRHRIDLPVLDKPGLDPRRDG